MVKTIVINYGNVDNFELLAASLSSTTNLLVNQKNLIKSNLEMSLMASKNLCIDFISYLNDKIKVFEFEYDSEPIKCNMVQIGVKHIEYYIGSGKFNYVNSLKFHVKFILNNFGEIVDIEYTCRGYVNQIEFKGEFELSEIDSILIKYISVFDYYHKRGHGLI